MSSICHPVRVQRMFSRAVVSAAVIFFLVCGSLIAQVISGSIFGSVTDPTGAIVSNATVTVRAPEIGVTRTIQTNEQGDFVVPNLPPANYSVTVEAPGFKKLDKQDIHLSAADRLNAGIFVLPVGATAEAVTVTADAGELQLQTNSGERSDVVTTKQLNDVAMNGRNALDYMKLIPGVTSAFSGKASGTGGLDQLNINGTRANQHEFTIDGASNVDTGNNGGTHVTLNTDAIEEVKVLTSNYQAEYGKAAGGQIAFITKGGTNQFHGNGRFFHRNEGLNANDYFNKKQQLSNSDPNNPEIYRYNYAGYQVGGPVLKNKIFFFWSQEFYRQLVPGGGVSTFYTPTALERQGDFSQSVDGSGKPIIISGPGITNNKIDPTQLPAAQQAIFAQMQKILNLFPLPNISGFGSNGLDHNYSNSFSANQPRREDILRMDYQINDKNRLFGRWIHNSDNTNAPFEPFPGPFGIFACSSSINFTGGCVQKHPSWNFSLNLVSTIKTNLLNEFSIGPSHTLSLAESVGGNISRGANGIDMQLLFPLGADQSIPDMNFNGWPSTSFSGPYLGATPWKQANTTINVNDNVTWVLHNHTLKTGVFYQRSRKDQIAWGNINGQFGFDVGPTAGGTCPGGTGTCTLGDPMASALLGAFNSFSQSTARPLGQFRYNQLEFFVQDTWKLTQKLTLDYGIRFAWMPPQYDAQNQVAIFDPAAYKAADAVTINPDGSIDTAAGGNPLNGMQFTKNGDIPTGGWNNRGIMPEPRFGFAYQLLHDTVLRGGFGMMHDRTQGNLIFNTVFNNPAVVRTASVPAGNITDLPNSPASFGNGVLGNILGAERDGKVPTVYSFSLGVQHKLGSNTTIDVAYVGTQGRHLVTSHDANAIPYGTAFTREAQDPAMFAGGVVPAVEPNLNPIYSDAGLDFSGRFALGRNAFSNAPLVPFKGYDQISMLQFNGNSNYNSLQVSLQRRFARGLTFGAAYTWSHSMVTANTDQDAQDPFNPSLDYRAASWDRTHVFAANYVYDLPSVSKHFGGPKWLGYITDNFQLSGVTQFMTGTPSDLQNNFSFPSGTFDGSNMWGAIPYYFVLDQNKNPIFPGVRSPLRGSRDILRNGGMQNWDMSLFKNIPIGKNENRYLQLRLEAYNAFNHPNFDTINHAVDANGPWQYADAATPVTFTKSTGWGKPTTTYNGAGGFRVVQLGAKIYF